LNNRIRSSDVQMGKSLVLENKKFNFKNSAEQSGEVSTEDKSELEKKKQQYEQEKRAEEYFDEKVKEAQSRSKSIIEEAEKKAAEIVKKSEEDAQKKAVEIENLSQQTIENAYAEGFQKGYDEGLTQAKHEVSDKIQGADVIASAAFKVKKEIINSAEKEIIELSTSIAEKIIRQQLELKPELMQEIIKSAIGQLKDREEIKIIVNPALTNNLYEFAEELKETVKGLKTVKISEDKTIPVDGVIVESPDSRIDGRIETQLAEIVRRLIREFSEKNNSEAIPEEIDAEIKKNISE